MVGSLSKAATATSCLRVSFSPWPAMPWPLSCRRLPQVAGFGPGKNASVTASLASRPLGPRPFHRGSDAVQGVGDGGQSVNQVRRLQSRVLLVGADQRLT